jgi:hypothetical protein
VNEEKRHADDYAPAEVEAARRVIIEVAQNLGEFAEACVLVGGWVPDLLLPDPEAQFTGSIDVDLALNPQRLSGGQYASLLDTLKRRGYEPGEKPFQLRKKVEVGGRMIPVDVDFLAPKGARMEKHRPKLVPGFRVLEADGCALAFRKPVAVTLEGKMPDGRQNRVMIRVAAVEDELVMKGYALVGRDKPKDTRDIYLCVKNYPGGPVALAASLKSRLREREVGLGLAHIAGKFRSESDFGPETVARFLNRPDKADRDFDRRDAFEQVDRLMRELGLKLLEDTNSEPPEDK